MNRRNFLRAAVALAVSPAIPAPAAAPLGAGGVIGATFVSRAAVLDESWVCFVHPDLIGDIRDYAGFVGVEMYASRKVIHPMEVGSYGGFRFIKSSGPM